MTLDDLKPCNDEEYLGACLGFAQHLSRYSVGRATVEDLKSIEVCRLTVIDLTERMMEFDFRNGPLRRKYDGLKYVMKKLENIKYEMSLLEDDNQVRKKAKTDDNSDEIRRVDKVCFDAIRQRYEAYDKLRETVIKGSRDVQKDSKQAIFSVHRGKLKEAQEKLDKATIAAGPLQEIVNEHSTLRDGAFGNSLEEWAEAYLTIGWVTDGTIRSMDSMAHMHITAADYVGALSDFTGEIGRLAVQAAGSRDLVTVKKVLNCVLVIQTALTQVNTSNRFNKKCDAVNGTMKKLEDVLYETTLVCRGGRSGREKEKVESNDDKDE